MSKKPYIEVEGTIWLLQDNTTGKYFFLEYMDALTSTTQYDNTDEALTAWRNGEVKMIFDDGSPPDGQLSLGI